MLKPQLICVVGPTAVGKTSLAIELANHFNTNIISADSRQFYKELEIGTAKPTLDELEQAPHQFINTLSIYDDYDVGKYEKEAISKLEELFKTNETLILVGGSGLFVDAICKGLDEFPEISPDFRDQLNSELEEFGLEVLCEELKVNDKAYYEIVDTKNPQRIIRALEVIRSTGKTFTEFRKRSFKERSFSVIKIGLETSREKLYERINHRMDLMIEHGLFDEAEQFLDVKHLNALQTVGYREIFGYLEGEYDREEAIRLLKRNSRRYAKRQLTWFKRDSETEWFEPNNYQEIIKYLDDRLKLSEPKN